VFLPPTGAITVRIIVDLVSVSRRAVAIIAADRAHLT